MLIEPLFSVLKSYSANGYLVGFSGGRDSHVLLDLLYRLRQRGELTTSLTAIHINHNLNPKSHDWAQHCQHICDAYQIPLIIETVTDAPKTGESLEAFARAARYGLIEQQLSTGDIFLSAHHQRDQAETVLLQLMRGAGLDGLKAMPIIRDLGAGQYLRPLLNADYATIVAYAAEQQLNYIEDDSNADTRFDRNYMRHEVLPVLAKRFPAACANIAQSAKWLAEVPDMPAPKHLELIELLELSEAQQKQQIRTFVKSKTGLSLSQTQTQYVLANHLTAGVDKHPTLTVSDKVIRRYEGELVVTQQLPPMQEPCLTIKCGQSLSISPIATLGWQRGQGIICAKSLTVKPLRGSERFHPHTRNHATTVKKILNEAKIPAWLRPYYVGLYVDNELLAIPGVGVARKHYQKSPNACLPLWIIADKFVRM